MAQQGGVIPTVASVLTSPQVQAANPGAHGIGKIAINALLS
jgi:hypothetical protein